MRRIVKRGKNKAVRKKILRSKMSEIVKKAQSQYAKNFEKNFEYKLLKAKNIEEKEGFVCYTYEKY